MSLALNVLAFPLTAGVATEQRTAAWPGQPQGRGQADGGRRWPACGKPSVLLTRVENGNVAKKAMTLASAREKRIIPCPTVMNLKENLLFPKHLC